MVQKLISNSPAGSPFHISLRTLKWHMADPGKFSSDMLSLLVRMTGLATEWNLYSGYSLQTLCADWWPTVHFFNLPYTVVMMASYKAVISEIHWVYSFVWELVTFHTVTKDLTNLCGSNVKLSPVCLLPVLPHTISWLLIPVSHHEKTFYFPA